VKGFRSKGLFQKPFSLREREGAVPAKAGMGGELKSGQHLKTDT